MAKTSYRSDDIERAIGTVWKWEQLFFLFLATNKRDRLKKMTRTGAWPVHRGGFLTPLVFNFNIFSAMRSLFILFFIGRSGLNDSSTDTYIVHI